MKAAIIEYRAMPAAEKAAFDPYGRPGAAYIRRLQEIAHAITTKSRSEVVARYGNNPKAQREVDQKIHIIPLGLRTAKEAQDAAKARYPRRRNWKPAQAVAHSVEAGEVEVEALRYRGGYRGFTGHEYRPLMRSACRLSADGRLLHAVIGHAADERHYTVQAGRGYRWDSDADGVRLIRLRDGADFHPDSDDIRLGRRHIVDALRGRAERSKLEYNPNEEVYVCLQDAIDAGIYHGAFMHYARRNGLKEHGHYLSSWLFPSLVMDCRAGVEMEVAKTIAAARRRQAQEKKQGFCKIA